jgi:osmotically-inducible protein OsmY
VHDRVHDRARAGAAICSVRALEHALRTHPGMRSRGKGGLSAIALGAALAAAARPAAAVEPPAVPDARIVRVLAAELKADRALARQPVMVDSRAGVVTIQGTVDNLHAKERVVALATVVRGVRAVVDRVEVARRPRPDDELEFAVAGALSRDPVTADQPIGARATRGTVRLSGSVGSQAVRGAAEADVLAVPGVVRLADDLAVRPAERPDAHLAVEADRVLRDDPWIDAERVRVSADRGVVRLSGHVRSAAERARAEADARVASPQGVDASWLRIDPFPDYGTWRDAPWRVTPDGDLRKALLDAYARDPRMQGFHPAVDVRDGAVVLTGIPPGPDAARAAVDDARNLPGAAAVHDALKPQAEGALTDDAVHNDVAGALARDPLVGPKHVRAIVHGGRVLLLGTVAGPADRRHAIEVANSAAGARAVDDELALEPPRIAMPDAELADAVRERLDRSGWIPAGVTVQVARGVVTLEGTVDDAGQRDAATDLAYSAGAKGVLNRLAIAR